MRAGRLAAGLVAALGLVSGAACTGDDSGARHATPRTVERPPDIDYSSTHLAKVNGTTTTLGVPETGTASIVGTVTGPGGPVPGATVHVEHLVGSSTVPHDVLTGPDGRYALPGIPGGRYRVRAFLAPALATKANDSRFLEDGKEAVFDLSLEDQRKVVAKAAVAPSVPYLGEPVNLSVVVATQQVDVDGIVRSTPVPGLRVELDGLGLWTLRRDADLQSPFPSRGTTTSTVPPSAVGFTDSVGVVAYQLRCNAAGDPGLGLLVTVTTTPAAVEGQPPPQPTQQVQRLGLDLPDCVDPSATTTTTVDAEAPSSSSPRRATTSTVPG
jgi:hypothetical protein